MFSPKRLARTAGLLYLAVAVFGGFAYGFVLTKVYAPGDAATTAANVLANAGLVRLGVVADLLQATVMAFLAMTLYRLLKHVNQNAASSMVILAAIATTIMCLNNVFQGAGLLVATNASYATAFGAQGANALVLLLLDMQHYGFLIAQIFFGLWLAPMGYLAYKSGMFPKALGVVLVVAGVCYLADVLTRFLVPDFGARIAVWGLVGYAVILGGSVLQIMGFNLSSIHTIPGGLWELLIGVWLLVKGFNASAFVAPARRTSTVPEPLLS